jgi:hypothetical protein
VQAEVELLRELQDLDQKLSEVRRNRVKFEGELGEVAGEVEKVQAMVTTLAGELETLQAQRREISQALTLEQDNVQKAEGRLPAIKTQKEYVAVLKEIDSAKKMNKELTDRIKAKDDQLSALERDKAEKDEALAAVEAKAAARRGEIEAGLADCDQQLGERGAKRDALLAKLPVPLRKRYQQLVERRGGVAIVAAHKGTCLGCNMQLPPQLFNSLYTSQELQNCPHCHRMLFIGQE